jgi:hypothetical protein
MGRKSREHREKRERQSDRANRLEEELRGLADGDASFCKPKQCPEGFWESHLEDVLAFESVGSGTSLFDGLQQHGLDLPHPDKLNERESAKKVVEVLKALEELRVILVGCSNMSARQFYRTLWNQTLWEGCYVKKKHPGALTLIDVSHAMPRSEMLALLEEAAKAGTVQ